MIQSYLADTVDTNETVDNDLRANYESQSNSNYNDNHAFLVYELQKRYKELQAVKDVNFRVKERECFGLLGVNGSGKSTTFRMMTGHEVLDHGIMYMGDKDYKSNKDYVSITISSR